MGELNRYLSSVNTASGLGGGIRPSSRGSGKPFETYSPPVTPQDIASMYSYRLQDPGAREMVANHKDLLAARRPSVASTLDRIGNDRKWVEILGKNRPKASLWKGIPTIDNASWDRRVYGDNLYREYNAAYKYARDHNIPFDIRDRLQALKAVTLKKGYVGPYALRGSNPFVLIGNPGTLGDLDALDKFVGGFRHATDRSPALEQIIGHEGGHAVTPGEFPRWAMGTFWNPLLRSKLSDIYDKGGIGALKPVYPEMSIPEIVPPMMALQKMFYTKLGHRARSQAEANRLLKPYLDMSDEEWKKTVPTLKNLDAIRGINYLRGLRYGDVPYSKDRYEALLDAMTYTMPAMARNQRRATATGYGGYNGGIAG